MKTAAIYARVSSDKQREENTIASQTSALIAFAREQNCDVPVEWVIEDDGYSGASLLRPGLERLRDLAAEGLIQVALVYAPDRLSRRYAHQILLIEEFARTGVEILFIRSKRAATPEDELLLQFQGMIAEYERAQILERSRRGKRHRARQGQVSVLSGAPFGYRYRRKTDHSAAYYEIDEEQARVVRWVYELYTAQGLSIGAITRQLYERQIPTAKGVKRWERSTVWAMLRNPAYKGTACFGKTRIAPRMRVTRPLRLRGGTTPRNREREICLRLAESVMSFLSRLRSSAETLDISERQRVLRLLVKEVLVGDDKIVIRHSIPMPHEPSGGKSPDPAERSATAPPPPQSYLLRSGRHHPALRNALLPAGFEHDLQQVHHVRIVHALSDFPLLELGRVVSTPRAGSSRICSVATNRNRLAGS